MSAREAACLALDAGRVVITISNAARGRRNPWEKPRRGCTAVHHPLIGYAHYDHRASRVNGYASGAGKWGAPPLTRVHWRWSVATTPIREKCAVTTDTRYVAGDTKQSQCLKNRDFCALGGSTDPPPGLSNSKNRRSEGTKGTIRRTVLYF